MADEEKKTLDPQGQEQQPTMKQYLEDLDSIRANSVSKEEYNKVMEENKELWNRVINGSPAPSTDDNGTKKTAAELSKELCSGNLSNIDYIKTSLEHRRRSIEERGYDPYLGISHTQAPTDEQIASANQVAEFLGKLVEDSKGNDIVFTNEYQRQVGDSLPNYRRY